MAQLCGFIGTAEKLAVVTDEFDRAGMAELPVHVGEVPARKAAW